MFLNILKIKMNIFVFNTSIEVIRVYLEYKNFEKEKINNVLKNGTKFYDPKNDAIIYVDKINGKYVMVATDKSTGNLKTTIKSSEYKKIIRPRFEKIKD